MSASFIALPWHGMINEQRGLMIQGQEDTLMAHLMEAIGREIPSRSTLMLGDGALNRETLDGILMMINCQFFNGLGPLIKGMRNK